MALKNNTWKLNQWYDQNVAGNAEYSSDQNKLWTWGNQESYGILGHNEQSVRHSSPTQIPGTNWSSFGGGWDNTQNAAAVKSDGTLWVWGRNLEGALGLNQTTNQYARSSPTQLPGTTWSDVSYRYFNMMGLKTDGTLWGWGRNQVGDIASNNEQKYSSPVQITGSGTTYSTLFSHYGGYGSLKTDGTLWMWGGNNHGALGQNNITQYSSPVQVGSDTTWSMTAKSMHTIALATKTDGTLWAWGNNTYGRLGQNAPENSLRSSPVQVGTETTWSFIDSTNNVGGIKTDGRLWLWGNNEVGQLGDNSRTQRSSPTQIPGTTWSDIVAGSQASLASKTDGTLWVWGRNVKGELGLNQPTSTEYSSPVQIPGFNSSGNKLTLSSLRIDAFAVLEQL